MIVSRVLCLALLVTMAPFNAHAEPVEATDVAGRTVRLDAPAQRVVISSTHYFEALGVLDNDNPARRVVGVSAGPGGDSWYLEQIYKTWPETKSIATFGGRGAESVSAEKIISLKPDLAILGLSDHGPSTDTTEFVTQLNKAGIQVAFIDFRMNPLENTGPSILLLGELLGRPEQASSFVNFVSERKKKIRKRLQDMKGERPKVFLQAHVGRMPCCIGMAKGMLGPFVTFAGGRNVSAEISPGPTGRHTEEFLISSNVDVFIGTASGTAEEVADGKAMILLGGGISRKDAESSLKRAIDTPAMKTLPAWKAKRVYGIWHTFYNSPFNIYALESFAKWIHPELFADLDPDATLSTIFERFSPFKLEGTYSIGLNGS